MEITQLREDVLVCLRGRKWQRSESNATQSPTAADVCIACLTGRCWMRFTSQASHSGLGGVKDSRITQSCSMPLPWGDEQHRGCSFTLKTPIALESRSQIFVRTNGATSKNITVIGRLTERNREMLREVIKQLFNALLKSDK